MSEKRQETTDFLSPPLRTQEEAALDALPKVLAEVERLQRHWRVRVCRWWATSVKPNAKLKHDRVNILVQAFTADSAMTNSQPVALAADSYNWTVTLLSVVWLKDPTINLIEVTVRGW